MSVLIRMQIALMLQPLLCLDRGLQYLSDYNDVYSPKVIFYLFVYPICMYPIVCFQINAVAIEEGGSRGWGWVRFYRLKGAEAALEGIKW